MISTLRFANSWLGGPSRLTTEDLTPELNSRLITRSRLILPRDEHDLPIWILFHGLSSTGIDHPMVVRFARALAASGAAVWLPEIEPWKRLDPSPDAVLPVVRSLLDASTNQAQLDAERVGLVGFSFGGPQVLLASQAPEIAARVCSLLLFGSYCDLQATLRYLFTGDAGGPVGKSGLAPDPYGRWIMASRFLTSVEGYELAGSVAQRLHRMAVDSSQRGVRADDPSMLTLYEHLLADLSDDDRPTFQALAGLRTPDTPEAGEQGRHWADQIFEAAVRANPTFEPATYVNRLSVPVFIAHGSDDRVIPATEAQKLAALLAPHVPTQLLVSGLFAHSDGSRPLGITMKIRETFRFYLGLSKLLGSVKGAETAIRH